MTIDNIVYAVTETAGHVHLFSPNPQQHERNFMLNIKKTPILIFIHITEHFLHLRVADSFVEVN